MYTGLIFHNKNRFKHAERRKKIMDAMREHPGLSQLELAEIIGVDRSTISRDMRVIADELRIQTSEDFMIHRDRVLREVQANKDECMRRLSLCKNPHQGSRWMDEWNKLVEKEIRMLGLNAPEKLMLAIKDEFSKEERDAAVNAALAGIDMIDITPETLKQLPMGTSDNGGGVPQ
jgi:DNA-binding MarR family transcriptional regulator